MEMWFSEFHTPDVKHSIRVNRQLYSRPVSYTHLVVGVPTALLLAIFLAFYCPKKLYAPLKAMVNLLAGIPSVVYGFFGLTVFVPLLRQLTGHDGSTMLTASVLLGIMILPTVTGVAEPALKSVPTSYYEGALALSLIHI